MEFRVAAVTVTYGRRWHFLRQVLESVFSQGVMSVIVVDNASRDAISQKAREEFGDRVTVVTLPSNTGSANGFRAGIEKALQTAATHLWLLDDDNLPQPGSLEALRAACGKLEGEAAADRFAVLSFRPDHQPDVAAGVPLERCYPRPGSFFGFHVLDIPYKLWRRTRWGRPRPRVLPELLPVPFAPYSGFLFHRSVIDRIGLPDTELVLYADDTEFTRRLTLSGGRIFLVPGSRVDDLETSWNTKSQFSSSFSGWLGGEGELRAFYGARNQAYLEVRNGAHRAMRGVNRATYLAILTVVAVVKGRMKRLRLLLYAVRQGESSQLGLHGKFPLS